MAWGWPPSSRQARSCSGSPSCPSAGSDFASSKAPERDSGPTRRNPSGGPAAAGGMNGWRQVMSILPRWVALAQWAINSARAGSRTVQSPDLAVRLASKLSRTSRTGRSPRIWSRSRVIRSAQGRSVRPASWTDSARLLPGVRAGWRRRAAATPASTPLTDTSPLMTAVTRSGSRWLTREAIWLARVDFPIPPAPYSTSPASAGPVRSAAQRRRSADRIGKDADKPGSSPPGPGSPVPRAGPPLPGPAVRAGAAAGAGARAAGAAGDPAIAGRAASASAIPAGVAVAGTFSRVIAKSSDCGRTGFATPTPPLPAGLTPD